MGSHDIIEPKLIYIKLLHFEIWSALDVIKIINEVQDVVKQSHYVLGLVVSKIYEFKITTLV